MGRDVIAASMRQLLSDAVSVLSRRRACGGRTIIANLIAR